MSELLYPIDSIEFSLKDPTRINPETAEFYRNGRSLGDIARELGCSKSKVRNDLKKAGVQVRKSLSHPTHRRKTNSGKQKALPYYGFCYFEGKIVPDPREFPTLTLINRLLKEKKTTHQITLELNSRKIKSRMGREWSWAAVQNIIDRFKKKKVILHGRGRFEFG